MLAIELFASKEDLALKAFHYTVNMVAKKFAEALQGKESAMDRFRKTFARIIAKGIASGELRADLNPDGTTTFLIAALEGAVMLTNLYKDPVHMRRVIDQLTEYLQSLKA